MQQTGKYFDIYTVHSVLCILGYFSKETSLPTLYLIRERAIMQLQPFSAFLSD